MCPDGFLIFFCIFTDVYPQHLNKTCTALNYTTHTILRTAAKALTSKPVNPS